MVFRRKVKTKPIITRSNTFSHASRQQHVFASSFVSFTGFSVSFVIDQSADIFSFGFTADTRLTSVQLLRTHRVAVFFFTILDLASQRFLRLKISTTSDGTHRYWSRDGLMVTALLSGARGLGSSPGQGHCVVFSGKTLYSHSASLHPGV